MYGLGGSRQHQCHDNKIKTEVSNQCSVLLHVLEARYLHKMWAKIIKIVTAIMIQENVVRA
jgi:hypothetical protein